MREGRVGVWSWLTITLCVLLLLPAVGLAQTGKIKGIVTDVDTGEPLPVANVLIEGSSRGAATDLDGNFVILAVRPGTYSVMASYAGYASVTITDVVVNIDLTTNLEFKLKQAVFEGEAVEVVFTKPEVKLDEVSKVTRVTGADLQMMAVQDVSQMIATVPGIKLDADGRIHIRGGRESEARFLVDGIDSRDPITGEVLPVNLSAVNVQEIQILTGGLSAEYGSAMSGLVTISTPEGAPDRYNGSFEWQTDGFSGDANSFNQDRVNLAVGGPIPFTETLMGHPLTFYLTGNVNLSDTRASLGVEHDNEDYLGYGFDVPRRQFNDWSGSVKLAYELSGSQRVSFYLNQRRRVFDVFPTGSGFTNGNYGWQYKHNLDNLPEATDERVSWNIDYTYNISDRSLITMSFGRQILDAELRPRGKDPDEFTLIEEIEEAQAFGQDLDNNGRWDQDADGDGVVHNGIDELGTDTDGNGFLDGVFDANGNNAYEGGGEGYEDLNMNGQWDRGEDWIDLNGNGVYDYAEPWTDRADPVSGVNNIGTWDPWDPYVDLNGNGLWDPAEPQLVEQDLNGNGRWDGERFQDANGDGIFNRWEEFVDTNGNGVWDPGEAFEDLNGNGVQDDGEGYDDANSNGLMDQQDLVDIEREDQSEPFWDGDLWLDTGEPFIDLPDPFTGAYNGRWDEGEPFWDLPSSNTGFIQGGFGSILGGATGLGIPTLNGQYDPPNSTFDEYELFTYWSGNPNMPVGYNYDPDKHGAEWVYGDFFLYDPNKSTWTNRTLHDTEAPVFDPPNFYYDEGQEQYIDYNGNGERNAEDLFLNPGRWDNSAVWAKRRTDEYTYRMSFTSQVHKFHEVKFGTEIKHYIMQQEEIQGPDQLYQGDAYVDPSQPYPGIGAVRDFWEYKPWEGSVYLKDKMEFEGLIVDVGLRSEFVVHDQKVVDESRRRVLAGEPGAVEADRGNIKFAPRLGISHPITGASKLFFNYGHLYQRPQYLYYYKATTTNLNEGTIGNPNLEFQKTVIYEVGVHTQVTPDLTLQITGYYRDIYDMISTVQQREQGVTYYQYVNLDYGRARGLELKLDRKFRDHYQVSVNYDFAYAYGKSSSSNSEFERRSLNQPVNFDEHPLDWDETHSVTINAALMYGKKEYPELFGFRLPLDDWLFTVQWTFGSGKPYTPSQYSTGMDPNLILENSERMPWTENTNILFEKNITINNNLKAILGVSVKNLFNKENWNEVYDETGSPIYAIHPLNPDYDPFVDRTEYDANPRNFGAGRQILFKIGFEF